MALCLIYPTHSMPKKKKFYAVAAGRKVGIYSDWDGCKEQVREEEEKRFPCASSEFVGGVFVVTRFVRVACVSLKDGTISLTQPHYYRRMASEAPSSRAFPPETRPLPLSRRIVQTRSVRRPVNDNVQSSRTPPSRYESTLMVAREGTPAPPGLELK